MPSEEAKVEINPNGGVSAWSSRPVLSLRGCGCCCSLVSLGCLAVIVALGLCVAAGFIAIAAVISFLSNLLFGAA